MFAPKSLDEWIASSSDDDDDDQPKKVATPSSSVTTSSTAAATTKPPTSSSPLTSIPIRSGGVTASATVSGATTPGGGSTSLASRSPALGNLTAVRERMANLLGSNKVEEIVTATREKKKSPLDSSDSDFESDNSEPKPITVDGGAASKQKPEQKETARRVVSSASQSQQQQQQQQQVITQEPPASTAAAATAIAAAAPQRYEEVEVMVVDRGCQTATTVEVQTDPEPAVFSCQQCYTSYFGHAPVSNGLPPCAGGIGTGGGAMTQFPHQQSPFSFLFPEQQQQQQFQGGMMPIKQQEEMAFQQVRQNLAPMSSKAINSQIDVIQRQIDALTRRIAATEI